MEITDTFTEIVGTELCFWVSYDHILIFQLTLNAIHAYINEKTVSTCNFS